MTVRVCGVGAALVLLHCCQEIQTIVDRFYFRFYFIFIIISIDFFISFFF